MDYIAIFVLSSAGMLVFYITTCPKDEKKKLTPQFARSIVIYIPAIITACVWAVRCLIR